MKQRLLLLNFLFFVFINAVLAAPPSYIQTKDGVIVFTDPVFTGLSSVVKLEVISDNIIRVTAVLDFDAKCDKKMRYKGKK